MTALWSVWHQPTNRFLTANRDPAVIVPVFVYLRLHQIYSAVVELESVPDSFRCEHYGLDSRTLQQELYQYRVQSPSLRHTHTAVDQPNHELMEKVQWIQSVMPRLSGASYTTLCSAAVRELTHNSASKFARLLQISPDQSVRHMKLAWERPQQ
jgi:hypothetical protein